MTIPEALRASSMVKQTITREILILERDSNKGKRTLTRSNDAFITSEVRTILPPT